MKKKFFHQRRMLNVSRYVLGRRALIERFAGLGRPKGAVNSSGAQAPATTVRGYNRIFDLSTYSSEEKASIERIIAFDRAVYCAEYRDVADGGVDPFEHYIRHGINEGRRPAHPTQSYPSGGQKTWLEDVIGFDPGFYAAAYPDVEGNPAEHLMAHGFRQNRMPFNSHDNFQAEQLLHQVLKNFDLNDEDPLEACAILQAEDWRPVAASLQLGANIKEIRAKPYRNNYWLGMAMSFLARGEMGLSACCYNFFFNQYIPNAWLGNATEWLIGTAQITKVTDAMAESDGVLATPDVAQSVIVSDPIFLNRRRQRAPSSVAIALPKPVYGVLGDVEVIGGTSLIFKGGHTVYYDYAESGPRARELQCPNLIHQIDDRCSFRIPLQTRSVDQAYWMLHDHGHNYHHWLLEILPRYLIARENGLSASTPLLVDSNLAVQMREILEALFEEPAPLIEVARGASISVGRLHCMTDICVNTVHTEDEPLPNDILISPTVIEKLRGLAAPYLTDLGGKLDLVQIARRNVGHRRLVNRTQLEATLTDAGLWSFDPGAADWAQQVQVFSNARLIVAEAGASLANIAFCRPGATIIVLVQGHPCSNYYYLCQLADLVGARLFFFECLRLEGSHMIGVQDDMIVPLGRLSEWVDRFIADPTFCPNHEDEPAPY